MKRKGFTLVELLVVIAIIGLLSTLAVTALGGARAKARDARRLSDVKQVQTSLELYYTDQADYPTHAGSGTKLGSASAKCLSYTNTTTSGFTATCGTTVYMSSVPTDPTPTVSGYEYVYVRGGATTYQLTYQLEKGTSEIPAGYQTATPAGIR